MYVLTFLSCLTSTHCLTNRTDLQISDNSEIRGMVSLTWTEVGKLPEQREMSIHRLADLRSYDDRNYNQLQSVLRILIMLDCHKEAEKLNC